MAKKQPAPGEPEMIATTATDDDGLPIPAPEPAPAINDPDTITVLVPKAFRLTLPNYTVKEYKAGLQPMLKEHADHWWSKAQGVTYYDAMAKVTESPQAATLKQVIDAKFHALNALAPAEKELHSNVLFERLRDALAAVE